MGNGCSSSAKDGDRVMVVYKAKNAPLTALPIVNSVELVDKLVALIMGGKELEEDFDETDAALQRVDVLREERPLLVSTRLLSALTSTDAIDLSIMIKERLAAMLMRYLCAFVSPKDSDGPSGPPAIPEADQIKLEAQISTEVTWCCGNVEMMPTSRLHCFMERAMLLVRLIKSTKDRTDTYVSFAVGMAKAVASMSIESAAGAVAEAASVLALDKFKELRGERQRSLVVRLFEVDLLRAVVLQSDAMADESNRREVLQRCVDSAVVGIDAHDDWLEACALIEVLFEAGRRTHPQSSLRAKITSTLQRLTQFETPWWKLSRYDTDWHIRAAAQRSIIVLHLVDSPEEPLVLTGDGDNRTAQFFLWATAADNDSQRAQRFSSELLRWHPPVVLPSKSTEQEGPHAVQHGGLSSTFTKVSSLLLQPLPGINVLEAVQQYHLSQAENLLAPWFVPISGTYTPIGGTRLDLRGMVQKWLLESNGTPVLCVLGGAGSGKSIALIQEMQAAWQQWPPKQQTSTGTAVSTVTLRIELNSITPEKAPTMVRDALRRCGVNEACWKWLLATQPPMLLLLDGLDELPSKKLRVLADTDAKEWKNLRAIVTCRPEYLASDGRDDELLQPAAAAPLTASLVSKIYVSPLSLQQVHASLSQRMSAADADAMWQKMRKTGGLVELAANPFVLQLIVEALPRLSGEARVTRSDVYRAFVDAYLEREAVMLCERSDQTSTSGALHALCVSIATCMHREGVTSFKPASSATDPHWSTMLIGVQVSSLLKRRGGAVQFIHKSVMEYFVSQSSNANAVMNTSYLLTAEHRALIHFLVDRARSDAGFSADIHTLIQASRGRTRNAAASFAAANAMTVLVVSQRYFRNADFSNTCLRGAILQGGVFVRCSFASADLSGCHIDNIKLHYCNLNNVDLSNARHQRPPLTGHTHDVQAVVFSPDGRTLASCSEDKTVRIWDAATGQGMHVLEGHTKEVNAVVYSPDGRSLASCSDDETVRLWDATTGMQRHVMDAHTRSVTSVVFSPDGLWLASCGRDSTVRLWDCDTGQQLHLLKGHTRSVTAIAFSPDGRSVVSCSRDKSVRLWDRDTGRRLHMLNGHNNAVIAVAFSPDGQSIASCGWDNTVRLWDVNTGEAVHVMEGHTKGVTVVVFSFDGRSVASGSDDKTIRIWNRVTGQSLFELKGHRGPVDAIVFTDGGRSLASCSHDGTIRLWDCSSGQALQVLEGHTAFVNSVAFSPDGRSLVSCSDDRTVRLWDRDTRRSLQVLEGHVGTVDGVIFHPDGRSIASCSRDTTVRLWNSRTGQALHVLEGHTRALAGMGLSPDGRLLASCSRDYTVRVWDYETGQALCVLEGHTEFVNGVAFSPDGRSLASCSDDNSVRLWDCSLGQLSHVLQGHTGNVTRVVFSPDGCSLASCSRDSTVRLWDPKTGEALHVLEGHAKEVRAVVFSPNSCLLASCSHCSSVLVWDRCTGQLWHTLEGHTGSVAGVLFSPDGRMLASAGTDHTVRLWDCDTAQPLFVLEGHLGSLISVVFSPDGRSLASWSWDRTVRLWDCHTGHPLHVLEGHTSSVAAVAFSPDGRSLASCGGDGTVRLWNCEKDSPPGVTVGGGSDELGVSRHVTSRSGESWMLFLLLGVSLGSLEVKQCQCECMVASSSTRELLTPQFTCSTDSNCRYHQNGDDA